MSSKFQGRDPVEAAVVLGVEVKTGEEGATLGKTGMLVLVARAEGGGLYWVDLSQAKGAGMVTGLWTPNKEASVWTTGAKLRTEPDVG